MKCARIFSGLVLGLFLLTAIPAFAASAVNVPGVCTVVDTDGASHTYSVQYRGICALFAAREQGAVSAYTLQNFSFGLFLQSLNGITPGATEYWALYKNGIEASVGLTDMAVVQGDTLLFRLTDFTTNEQIGSGVEFSIGSLVSPGAVSQPSGGGIENIAPDFDVTKAVLFLKSMQNADGALPEALLSDWAAFAFKSHDIGDARGKLREYFLRWKPALSKTTDYERHAMALLALDINPYAGTATDYITPIVKAFDGTQVGDPLLINDDIFAIFPLSHAGYRPEEDMLRRIRDTVIAAQRPDGSWEGSVDLTAAAIQALALFKRTDATRIALGRAEGYLLSQQADDGGFGNSFSTAWVLQAIAAMGDSHAIWTKQIYHTPRYYFSALQQRDGGVETGTIDSFTRLWATAYAVPGVMGRTWDSLMEQFQKPATITPSPADASSTPAIATSTSPQAETNLAMALLSETLRKAPLPTSRTQPAPKEKISSQGENVVQEITATPPANQTASVAATDSKGFLNGLWHAVTSFFGRFF